MIRRTNVKIFYQVMILVMIATSVLAGCGRKAVSMPRPAELKSHSFSRSDVARSVVSLARAQIGKPYRWGGSSPSEGFDCSGLVWFVYKMHGVSLPRVSWQQISAGKAVHKSRLQAGDIVFFKIPGQGKSYHTGIYAGSGSFFVHSPKGGHTVREESMDKKYWRRYYAGARRVL